MKESLLRLLRTDECRSAGAKKIKQCKEELAGTGGQQALVQQ
jgi:hypothetical protein